MTARGQDTSHLRVKYTGLPVYDGKRTGHKPSEGEIYRGLPVYEGKRTGHKPSEGEIYRGLPVYDGKRTGHKPSEGEIYRGLPVYDGKRTPKPTKPREPKSREAMKFLRLLGKTCEGMLPKFGLPKLPKDCRGN